MLKVKCFPLGELQANCYFVMDESTGEALVVDPGDVSAMLETAIDSEAMGKLSYILLTHGHFDHIGGAARLKKEYPEAKIVIGEPDDAFTKDTRLNLGWHFGLSPKEFSADIKVNEGDSLPFGGGTINVMLTPGHTRGGACYIIDDCIFTGDTLISGTTGRTDFPTGNVCDMYRSMLRLAEIEGDLRVFCGHGEPSTLQYERQYNPFMRKRS